VQFDAALRRERHIGEHVGRGFVEKIGEFGKLGAHWSETLRHCAGTFGIVLCKRRRDEGGDNTAALAAGMREHIAHEVHAAALLGGVEHFGDGGLDTLVGVRDAELDAAQTASRELAQERGPEGLGLGRTDIHAKHLAPAVAVDTDRDDHGDRDDEERLHLLVDLSAQPRHLALGDAAHAQSLHQVIDRARRDAVDIGLLHDRGQRLLSDATRLEATLTNTSTPSTHPA
jgi:hypothetical protein